LTDAVLPPRSLLHTSRPGLARPRRSPWARPDAVPEPQFADRSARIAPGRRGPPGGSGPPTDGIPPRPASTPSAPRARRATSGEPPRTEAEIGPGRRHRRRPRRPRDPHGTRGPGHRGEGFWTRVGTRRGCRLRTGRGTARSGPQKIPRTPVRGRADRGARSVPHRGAHHRAAPPRFVVVRRPRGAR